MVDEGSNIVAAVGEVTTIFTAETIEELPPPKKPLPPRVRVVGVVLPAVAGALEVTAGAESAEDIENPVDELKVFV